jgi:hypothetical protein
MKISRIEQGVFGRWIIVHPDDDNLAWSGSRWVPHSAGLPIGNVQVSNFSTWREAYEYAQDIPEEAA